MRESRPYGSVRGACDETHVPTATALPPTYLIADAQGRLWHKPEVSGVAAIPSAIGRTSDMPRAHFYRQGQTHS